MGWAGKVLPRGPSVRLRLRLLGKIDFATTADEQDCYVVRGGLITSPLVYGVLLLVRRTLSVSPSFLLSSASSAPSFLARLGGWL